MARPGWHGESRRHAEAAMQARNEVDEATARELVLYAENDQELYKQLKPWHDNYKKKIQKGTFNNALAIKGLANNYVPRIIAKYRQDFGLAQVNQATKEAIAREILPTVLDDSRW